MNTQDIQNVGASQEAVAQNNETISFAAKAKDMAEKAIFPVIATAVTVSTVACATYRVIKLVRLIRGDEK